MNEQVELWLSSTGREIWARDPHVPICESCVGTNIWARQSFLGIEMDPDPLRMCGDCGHHFRSAFGMPTSPTARPVRPAFGEPDNDERERFDLFRMARIPKGTGTRADAAPEEAAPDSTLARMATGFSHEPVPTSKSEQKEVTRA